MFLFCPFFGTVAFYSPPITIYPTPFYEPIAQSIHVSWLCVLKWLQKKQPKKHRLVHPRGPLPDWPVWTREKMISGSAAEREDREDEAERDKPNGTQPAPDKREQAPSGAFSQEHECDKGEDTPMSLNKTRSLSNDKGVPSQQEHTNSLEVTTMHSDSESTLVSLRADKSGSTLPPLDKRAQDKNEDGEEGPAPPPTLQTKP
jgi:hypothetical protein